MTIEPAWLAHARAELGEHEIAGPGSNPTIIGYRADAGLAAVKGDDSSVPWCAFFVGAMLKRAGIKPSGSGMARSYSRWGNPCPIGTPGAVTVISSSRGPAAGHVFFATGRLTDAHIEGLGGNQGDGVSIQWWPLSRFVASRWPAELQPPLGKPRMIASAAPAKQVSDA